MPKEDKMLTLITDDGKEIQAEILFTYHSDDFNKDYVVFLPEGEDSPTAACYVESDETNGNLSPVETDEEWEMLEDLLADFSNSEE